MSFFTLKNRTGWLKKFVFQDSYFVIFWASTVPVPNHQTNMDKLHPLLPISAWISASPMARFQNASAEYGGGRGVWMAFEVAQVCNQMAQPITLQNSFQGFQVFVPPKPTPSIQVHTKRVQA